MSNKPTTKTTKQKKIKLGMRTLIDAETGEEVYVNQIQQDVKGDVNFDKIWLAHILQALDSLGNTKMKVISWLIANKDYKNIVLGTYESIAVGAGVSKESVRQTIPILVEMNILKRVQNGVYMFNPDIIFKGYHKARMNILLTYNNIEAKQADLFSIEQSKDKKQAG